MKNISNLIFFPYNYLVILMQFINPSEFLLPPWLEIPHFKLNLSNHSIILNWFFLFTYVLALQFNYRGFRICLISGWAHSSFFILFYLLSLIYFFYINFRINLATKKFCYFYWVVLHLCMYIYVLGLWYLWINYKN